MGDVEAGSERKVARLRWAQFARLASGFWRGENRRAAWLLTGGVVICVGLQLSAQLSLNFWNRHFFDALEQKKIEALTANVLMLPILVLFSGGAVSAALVAKMTLQLRWREWLTGKLAGWWISDQRYYRLTVASEEQRFPEYRIADDVRLALDPLTEFAIGVLTAAVTATVFISILWNVGGSAKFAIAGFEVTVPGYLAFSALLYTLVAGSATLLSGRAIVGAVARKNESEAQFRSELTRLRENAESIALTRGDADEYKHVMLCFAEVAKAWLYQIRQNGLIASVQSANGAFVPLFPLVLVAPKYLSDEITLGAVMQSASAFVTVQVSFNWFVDNFVRLAEWMASANRVDELAEALEGLDVAVIMEESGGIEFGESEDDKVRIKNLSVAHRNGRIVVAGANAELGPGEKILVSGESGSGKSTLVRAIGGLWPWGSGQILLPKAITMAFVPQKPYVPPGTLRDVLLYSLPEREFSDEKIHKTLSCCGLGHLARRLDKVERWDQVLCGGERQRIAFARLLLQRPQLIILDEATSAIDDEGQASLLRLLNEDLAHATVIGVGHHPALENFYDRKLLLERRPAGSRVVNRKLRKSFWRKLKELRLASLAPR
ncbi:ABC transporter ATP-binding protein/permease [Methylocystis sp. IM4]